MDIVAVVGNPRPASYTRTAAEVVVRLLEREGGDDCSAHVIELAPLGPELVGTEPGAAAREALQRVRRADVLVVASPTYKATYTGLLKLFLDALPGGALSGVDALPVLVMASPAHSMAVDAHLRPVLVELGAHVPTPGLVLLEQQVHRIDDLVDDWVTQVAGQLDRHTDAAPSVRRRTRQETIGFPGHGSPGGRGSGLC
ncbi:NADPH-dependent FMN reductase [Streptomyces sp. NPDC057580]|uniref:NADPH-dependent FMN reductase n=1 Tax=Streptomyces sp. NPDC057580 TaxID=3346173 RepID=UPI0036C70211